ncbi:MAG TPA: hypothetical protein HA346_04835 [Thermoplasmata archaeon]|nr:hypothetical protein [Thermoplasmata archaeon]
MDDSKRYDLPGIKRVDLIIKGGECYYKLGDKQTKTYSIKIFAERGHLAKIAAELGVKEVDIGIAEDRQHQIIAKILEDLKAEDEVSKLFKLPDRGETHIFSVYLPLKKLKDGKPQDYLIKFTSGERGAINRTILEEERFIPMETAPSQYFYLNDEKFPTLYEELKTMQSNYLYFEDKIYYDLLALGAASTYFREIFSSYPYFDLFSAENETGKTTAMKVLIWCSFHGFCLLGPSEEVLFRTIDSCHSALGIDELDKLYLNYKENANVFALLDSGYSRGLTCYRINEAGGSPKITNYDGFGLKAFTRTKAISKELQSRSIIINMLRNKGFKKINRDPRPSDFQSIRDNLYAHRLRGWHEVQESYNGIGTSDFLQGRLADLFYPLLSMAKLVSDQLFSDVLEYAKQEEKIRAHIQLDPIDKALIRTLVEQKLVGEVEVKKITDLVNKKLIEQGEIDKRHMVWPRMIEMKLRGFGFRPGTRKRDDKTRYLIDKDRPMRLKKIYL